jgi:xylan 1,4-beta-xylosidase
MHLLTRTVALGLVLGMSSPGLAPVPSEAGLQIANPNPVIIRVDAAHPKGELRPVWRFFGADEPNYAYMKDGRKLLGKLGRLGSQTAYFRTHNLLTSGDGTPALKWGSTGVYREDTEGRPVYDWTILDRIFDTYRESGVKPYVQMGFMPKDLSVKPEPYQHQWRPGAKYDEIYRGWAYPPKDYARWGELVFQWAKHCVARYGREQVETWYWEVWNEPNIGYWRGTPQEFYMLHDYAIAAVRRALPSARVGGPDVAGGPGGKFLGNFLEHCLRGTNSATGRIGTPTDFISFHAKGAPEFVEGHVRMGLAHQLRDIDVGFAAIAAFPELKDKPIIIGESDPDGCAACQGRQLGYRNGALYACYTAASVAREYELAEKHRVNFEGALTWAFEFEGQPYFAGFRALASNGLDLPVLNVFRMFGKMSGQRLPVQSTGAMDLNQVLQRGVRAAPEVSALAASSDRKISVLIWHYHDDDVPAPPVEIELELNGLPFPRGAATLKHYRIDDEHSNAFTAWERMGSPSQPTQDQYTQLEHAGQLTELEPPKKIAITGKFSLRLNLPRQAVSLLVLESSL